MSAFLGLRTAFAIAGAGTLVMSLWKVPDEATRRLMSISRRSCRQGDREGDALRGAQQYVRWSHPDPYYWGAFILQGDAIRSLALPVLVATVE